MAVADAPCQYKLGSSLDHRRVAAFRGGRDFVLVRPRFPMVQGAARTIFVRDGYLPPPPPVGLKKKSLLCMLISDARNRVLPYSLRL